MESEARGGASAAACERSSTAGGGEAPGFARSLTYQPSFSETTRVGKVLCGMLGEIGVS